MVYFDDRRQQRSRQDNQMCNFFMKTGICKYGEKCTKKHTKPLRSHTVMFHRLYSDPVYIERGKLLNEMKKSGRLEQSHGYNPNLLEEAAKKDGFDKEKAQKQLEQFFSDVFVELSLKYGKIQDMGVAGNLNKYLNGNVYVEFENESSASMCFLKTNKRWYNGKPIICELSPVVNLDAACCQSYETSSKCDRDSSCGYAHFLKIDPKLEKTLYASQWKYYHSKHLDD